MAALAARRLLYSSASTWDAYAGLPLGEKQAKVARKIAGTPNIRPTFHRLTAPEAEALLQNGLVGLNIYLLRQGVPGIEAAIERGEVVYYPRDEQERFRSVRDIWLDTNPSIAGGKPHGDCEDLAAAVAAERTLRGQPSTVILNDAGNLVSHAVVKDLRTGRIIDPSVAAGMAPEETR